MARFKDEAFVLNGFAPHLQPGERILYYAYGVKQPNILLIVLLLGGLLAWLLTKEAVVPRKLSRAAIETLAIIAYHQARRRRRFVQGGRQRGGRHR